MSKRDPKLFIEDMINALEKIEKYCKGIKTFEEFSKKEMVVDAVLRNLEIIGESASKIPEDFHNKYKKIPWKRIIGLRNVVIHEYFAVDLKIIWTIITTQLPELKILLEEIRKDLK